MLDQVYGAIADPTRRAILGILAEGETNVGSLAERFPISRDAEAVPRQRPVVGGEQSRRILQPEPGVQYADPRAPRVSRHGGAPLGMA